MKHRIRKTGEIIEVISYSSTPDRCNATDYVSYIDSKGEEHHRESLNYYWDLQDVEESEGLRKRIEYVKQQLEKSIRSATESLINSGSDEMQTYAATCRHCYVGCLEMINEALK